MGAGRAGMVQNKDKWVRCQQCNNSKGWTWIDRIDVDKSGSLRCKVCNTQWPRWARKKAEWMHQRRKESSEDGSGAPRDEKKDVRLQKEYRQACEKGDKVREAFLVVNEGFVPVAKDTNPMVAVEEAARKVRAGVNKRNATLDHIESLEEKMRMAREKLVEQSDELLEARSKYVRASTVEGIPATPAMPSGVGEEPEFSKEAFILTQEEREVMDESDVQAFQLIIDETAQVYKQNKESMATLMEYQAKVEAGKKAMRERFEKLRTARPVKRKMEGDEASPSGSSAPDSKSEDTVSNSTPHGGKEADEEDRIKKEKEKAARAERIRGAAERAENDAKSCAATRLRPLK